MNVAIRGINLHVDPPAKLCNTLLKGGTFALGGALLVAEPVIGAIAVGTVFVSNEIFDKECCLNKLFRWIGF